MEEIPPNLVSMDQEFRSSLTGWPWCKVSHKAVVKMLAETAVIWRLNWGGEIRFRDGSLILLASWWWLLPRSLNSWPHKHCHRAVIRVLITDQLVDPRASDPRDSKVELQCLDDSTSEVTHCCFYTCMAALFIVGRHYTRA